MERTESRPLLLRRRVCRDEYPGDPNAITCYLKWSSDERREGKFEEKLNGAVGNPPHGDAPQMLGANFVGEVIYSNSADYNLGTLFCKKHPDQLFTTNTPSSSSHALSKLYRINAMGGFCRQGRSKQFADQ